MSIPDTFHALQALQDRLRHARAKHPAGASFDALVAELGEVAEARKLGDHDHARDELLDVATVALRLWIGEVTP